LSLYEPCPARKSDEDEEVHSIDNKASDRNIDGSVLTGEHDLEMLVVQDQLEILVKDLFQNSEFWKL